MDLEGENTTVSKNFPSNDYIFYKNIQWKITQPLKLKMPFATAWMDLEIVTLSEVREGELLYDIFYMWNLK